MSLTLANPRPKDLIVKSSSHSETPAKESGKCTQKQGRWTRPICEHYQHLSTECCLIHLVWNTLCWALCLPDLRNRCPLLWWTCVKFILAEGSFCIFIFGKRSLGSVWQLCLSVYGGIGELRSGFLWENCHGARAQGNLLFPCMPELPHILLSKLSTSWRKQYNLISCTFSSIKNQLLQSKCSSARIGGDAPFGGAVCSVHKDPNSPQGQNHTVQDFGGWLGQAR